MKEKTNLNEQERTKELESLRQRHAEVVNEIDQMFVRILLYLVGSGIYFTVAACFLC